MDQNFAAFGDGLGDELERIGKVLDQVGLVHVWHTDEFVHELAREAWGIDVGDLDDMGDAHLLQVS